MDAFEISSLENTIATLTRLYDKTAPSQDKATLGSVIMNLQDLLLRAKNR